MKEFIEYMKQGDLDKVLSYFESLDKEKQKDCLDLDHIEHNSP